MMSKGKRSSQLKPGPALPVLASATKTTLTEHLSLKKNCLRFFGRKEKKSLRKPGPAACIKDGFLVIIMGARRIKN
eukprot:985449-Pelagomonas_calceolata.AAC.1